MICAKCGQERPVDHFVTKSRQCRQCRTRWNKEWRKRNREKSTKATLAWQHRNKERVDEIVHKSRLKRLYKMSEETYELLNREQNGLCAICGGPPIGGRRRLGVDHNHVTGRIRGLLCIRCNHLVGELEKNQELIVMCQEYILFYSLNLNNSAAMSAVPTNGDMDAVLQPTP